MKWSKSMFKEEVWVVEFRVWINSFNVQIILRSHRKMRTSLIRPTSFTTVCCFRLNRKLLTSLYSYLFLSPFYGSFPVLVCRISCGHTTHWIWGSQLQNCLHFFCYIDIYYSKLVSNPHIMKFIKKKKGHRNYGNKNSMHLPRKKMKKRKFLHSKEINLIWLFMLRGFCS